MRRLASIALHAEKLHHEPVWRAAERLAGAAGRRGWPLTFLVHPFWPVVEGAEIGDRVRRLAELGHEIGQHTHYYDAETGRVPGHKANDLDARNVARRLDEDHAWLLARGVRPAGFVSGGWVVPDGLADRLAARGFAYDCTARTGVAPHHGEPPPGDPAQRGGLPRHGEPAILRPGLVEVPTTAPLRRAAGGLLRRFPPAVTVGDLTYQLVYLHDDDLLDRRKRVALAATMVVLRARGYVLVPAAELAGALRPLLEPAR